MNKKMRKRIILLMSVIFMFSIFVGCSKDVKTDLTPAEHIAQATESTMEQGSFDLTAKATLNLDYDELTQEYGEIEVSKELFDLISNFSANINYKLKTDQEARTIDYLLDYNIEYKSLSLLSMNFILNNEEFGIGLTNFFDKYFVVDFNFIVTQLAAQEGLEEISKIDFKPYVDILLNTESDEYIKVSENTVYNDIMMKHLDERLSEGVTEEITFATNDIEQTEHVLTYNYDFSFDGYMQLVLELAEVAIKDEDMKAYVEYLLTEMLDHFVESKDYEYFALSEEEMVALKELFDTEFDEFWIELVEEYEYSFEELQNEMNDLGDDLELVKEVYENIDIKISINDDMMIRKVAAKVDYKGIEVNLDYVINAVGEDVVIESNEDKYVNIFDYVDLENPEELKNVNELAVLLKEMAVSVIDELMNGEAYTTLLSDLEPFEEELGFEFATISLYLGLAKAEVDKMDVDEIALLIQESYSSQFTTYDDYDYEDDYSDEAVELSPLDSIAFIAFDSIESSSVSRSMWNAVDIAAQNYDVAFEYTLTDAENADTDFDNAVLYGSDIIFVQGEELNDALGYYADLYPEVQFISLDSTPDYYNMNVIQIEYYNEETAYVAGAIAALTSESGKIAFVGGVEDIYTRNYEIAYNDGALSINPDIVIENFYAGSTTDLTTVDTIVTSISQGGYDIVYHAAGDVGQAVMDASDNNEYKVIGNESDYGYNLNGYLTTTLKEYDSVIDYILDDYSYGYLNSYYSFGAYDALIIPDGYLSTEAINLRDELVEQISSGDLYIPTYYGD